MNKHFLKHTYFYHILRLLILPLFSKNQNRYDKTVLRSETDCIGDSCSFFENNGKMIGVRDWIVDDLKLKFVRAKKNYAVLLSENNTLYVIENGKLFRIADNQKMFLSCFATFDYMYYDMVHLGKYFAIRSGGTIYVSSDTKEWNKVYSGCRGIRKSMVMVERNNQHYLIFIEYSPGITTHNHCILEYSFDTNNIRAIKEYNNIRAVDYNPNIDFARHIHLIDRDPYTGDLYVGTGDFDFEPGIYISKDKGFSFVKFGGGSPQYRVLSFFFSERSIFWSTDTPEPQFIYKYDRETKEISRFSLINSALWCSLKSLNNGRDFYILSSNSEGALFDNNNRVYGIDFSNESPTVYQLVSRRSRTQYSQLLPCCCIGDRYFFYDTDSLLTLEYKLVSK